MNLTKLPVFFTAGLLALCLTACGGGQSPSAETGEYQTHTYDYQSSIIDVSLDLRGGWDAEFGPETACLYDGPRESESAPVAFGR